MENNQKNISKLEKVSSISEFRKMRKELNVGKLIKLPQSGLVVMVARPFVEELIINDKFPKDLIIIARKAQMGQASPEDIKKVIELRDFMVMASVKQPVIVKDNPTKTQITLDSLPRIDRDYIYNYLEEGNDFLERFSNPQQPE